MKSAGGKSNSTTKEDIHKEFFTACREGNLDMLLDSIENGVDVNLETGFTGFVVDLTSQLYTDVLML